MATKFGSIMSDSSNHDDEQERLLNGTSNANANYRRTRSSRQSSSSPSFFSFLNSTNMVAVVIAVTLVLMLVWWDSFFVVHPGEVVVVVTLGHITTALPGPHFRTPLVSTINRMSTQTQLLQQGNAIPTREGLNVYLDTAILYRINATMAGHLYQTVGMDYCGVLLEPEAASAVRGLTSEKEAKALYSSGRNEIQLSVKQELQVSLGPRGIFVEDVLLKDIKLPDELSQSIELKAKAEQDAARMEFVLQKERQEADRKAIEAKGIADFQRIVSEGISENLLKWKGIEATEKLSESKNAKIVMVGNTGTSLPVLFSAAPSDEELASGAK